MNRIDKIFRDLRARQAKALMPFVTAGDPDMDVTGELLTAMESAGAHICELGIPFSDPVADGPVIDASMHHALLHGATPAKVFQMVADRRDKLGLGLVAMVSYSVVHRVGLEAFVRDADQAGIDGCIFPDLALEESQPARDVLGKHDLAFGMLIAPSSSPQRAERIAKACSGFIYLLARAGITGEGNSPATNLDQRVAMLRQVSDLPIAVGFGVSTAADVRQVVRSADAAIVGSAIMRRIAQARELGPDKLVQQVESFVRELASGLETAAVP